ncbi:MAG: rod-binding protein [Buchnera aphidicola (Pentalonia nigronervosa)]|jgi:flagellar protein FlgJ|uniref:Rod-binding protein n=1 Tax=Buchnera aphidicola (Pentalonia nigronervosa) TaxID=1309793 RepID=A0A7H1AZW8_9GAMM|nr:MAG: rod-binding protein [Buchnera aphidicola (Pentalonia nigronervosa)]
MKNNLFFLSKNIFNDTIQSMHKIKFQTHHHSNKNYLKIAQEVESIFIQMLLKNMRNSLLKNDLFDNNQSRLYTDVFDQNLSQQIASKGLGLQNAILAQLEFNPMLENNKT